MQYKSHLTDKLLELIDDNPFSISAPFSSIKDVAEEAYMEFRGYINIRLRDHLELVLDDEYEKMEYLIWRDDLRMTGEQLKNFPIPTEDEAAQLRTRLEYAIMREREMQFDTQVSNCTTEQDLDALLIEFDRFMQKYAGVLGVEPDDWKFEVLSELHSKDTQAKERVERGQTFWQQEDPEMVESMERHRAELEAELGRTPKKPKEGTVIRFPRK